MFHIIVLAAGLSRRMGAENKLLLPWGNKTILETTLDNIVRANVGKVWVVVGHEAEYIKELIKNDSHSHSFQRSSFGKGAIIVNIVTNAAYEKGMATSIQAGIKAIPLSEIDSTTGFMIGLSDMPMITSDEYRLISNHFLEKIKQDEKAIIRPVFNGQKGNPIVFSAYYRKSILELATATSKDSHDEGCRSIVQNHTEHVYEINMLTDSVLQDMDNPEDYKGLLLKRKYNNF